MHLFIDFEQLILDYFIIFLNLFFQNFLFFKYSEYIIVRIISDPRSNIHIARLFEN